MSSKKGIDELFTLLHDNSDGVRTKIVSILNSSANLNLNSSGSDGIPMYASLYYSGMSDLFPSFVSKGLDLNSTLGWRRCALALASMNADPDVANILLDLGADPNLKSGDDMVTPLMMAAQSGCYKIARQLLVYGADVNAVDAHGDSALYYAVKHNNPEVTDILLDAGIDVQSIANKFPEKCSELQNRQLKKLTDKARSSGSDFGL